MACRWPALDAGLVRADLGHLCAVQRRCMNVVIVGVRDIDQNEKDNIRKSGITEIYTMRDIG